MPEPHTPAPHSRAVVAQLRLVPPNATLVLVGELDLHTADQLQTALEAVAASSVESLDIDLSGVQFASLSALGALVDSARSIHQRGGLVSVRGVRALQRRVLALLGAPDAMVIVPGERG